jgi:histidyl-tRNA synthetase
MSKPSIPKGTRDFGPDVMVKRNYIFSTIRKTFERYGYLPLETPAMENLSTLTGKYGEEGDQLVFKILNNGDFLKKADESALEEKNSKKLSFSISKKALRYDLTVPFARWVVMNHGTTGFPFKRYQIQPVWRGDRPGKGRYQEFYQCDVDIVGSNDLYCEIELVQIFDDVLSALQIPGFEIKINNRKILTALAQVIGVEDRMTDMTVAIDKLDKIGRDGVTKELNERGFDEKAINQIIEYVEFEGDNAAKMDFLKDLLGDNEMGAKGLEEMRFVLSHIEELGLDQGVLDFDQSLARGLDYYTGAIFEVKVPTASVGSICGGGRYDDLTGIFGLSGVSGVGISFGADRIYDVMEEFDLFPERQSGWTQLLLTNFGPDEAKYCLKLLKELRAKGVNAELYPSSAKLGKQMKYADGKNIPFVGLVGSREMETGVITIKNMVSGDQTPVDIAELYEFIANA